MTHAFAVQEHYQWLLRSAARPRREYYQRIAFGLAWLVAFAVPWGDMIWLKYEIQASRVFTLAVAVFIAISLWRRGSLRTLNGVHWWMILFVVWSAAAIMWTAEPDRSLRRILSYYQLFSCAWLIHQCSSTAERHFRLLGAYVLGCFVVCGGLVFNYVQGLTQGDGRYTAPGFDPNDLAVTLILGIPIAWYLSLRIKNRRWLHRVYIPCAILAALLTASRAGLITLAIALIYPLLSVPKSSVKAIVSLLLLIVLSGLTVTAFMSDISVRRLSTITDQLASRDLNGRVSIWERGLEAFPEHPLAGSGAGTFANAIGARHSREIAAHNSFLGVLVEHGLVGLLLFAGAVLSLYRRAFRCPAVECRMWLVTLTAWGAAASTLSWENRELTWLLWGLCAAQPPFRITSARPAQRSYHVFTPSTM